VPAGDADQLTVTVATRDDVSAPTGTDAGLYEVSTANGSSLEQVTYRFAVDGNVVDDGGQLRVLASNGSGAKTVDHTVVENGSTMVVAATTDVVDRVVVATVRPDVSTGTITTDGEATTDAPVTIETTLTNDGSADATETVELTIDGTVVDSRSVTVPANGATTVSFETQFDSAGDRRVGVAGSERSISVAEAGRQVELTGVSVDQNQVRAGAPFDVSATFENTGGEAAPAQANFAVAGTVVDSKRPTVPARETETVTFTYTAEDAGELTIAVNGERRIVTVDDAQRTQAVTDAATDGGTSTQNIGLAVVGFTVLIIGAGALVRVL